MSENALRELLKKILQERPTLSDYRIKRAVLALEGVDFKKHSGVTQYFQREHIKTEHFDKNYSNIIMNASTIRNASDKVVAASRCIQNK